MTYNNLCHSVKFVIITLHRELLKVNIIILRMVNIEKYICSIAMYNYAADDCKFMLSMVYI